MTTNYHFIYLAAALVLGLAGGGCSSESLVGGDAVSGTPARIVGSIGTAPVVETKAAVGNSDNLSYETFQNGDAIGFFSVGGLTAGNEKLTYSDGSFKGPEGDDALIWNEGTAQRVYAYYPYSAASAGAEEEYAVSVWRQARHGQWAEGFDDLLAASANNLTNGSLISLAFSHQFAMLILKRGEGFEQNTSGVTVRLNYSIGKQAHISRKEWNTSLRLQEDQTGGVAELTGNAGTYKPTGSAGQGVACYYVMIPVGEVYNGGVKQDKALTVASVTLENNAGRELTVPFSLSAGPFQANTKYLVTVKMRDNQAVIEPEEIRRWEEETIPVEIPAGIGSAQDFETWVATYNDLTASDRNAILGRYGTFDAATSKWTFLLLQDFSYTFPIVPSSVITQFADIFDGQGHTLSGLSLAGAPIAGFFGTLSGEVKNLKLHNIQVEKTASTLSSDPSYYGALAGRVASGGRISRCQVTGDASFVVGTGTTGGLVGLLESGGSLTDCTSSAVVAGTDPATTDRLVGRNDGGTLSGCTATGTLITNN